MEPITNVNYRQPPTKKPISIFAQNSTGYNKLKNRIPETLMDHIAAKCMNWAEENEKIIKNSEVVFQYEENLEKNNDKKRRQIGVQKIIDEKSYKLLKEAVDDVINEMYPTHYIYRPGKLIISLPGCGMQMMHMDFEEVDNPEHVQIPIFVGLMDSHIDMITGGELFNRNYYRVNYEKGDVVIMHGNQIHRGCKYDKLNIRLYFYAIHKGIKDNNKDGNDSFSKPNTQIKPRNNNNNDNNIQ